jgi:hypothetical protein
MDRKPFVRLAAHRAVNRPELPPELAEFYAWHDGIGLESHCDHYPLRLCKLDEVARGGWDDLGLVGEVPEGWEDYDGCQIGMGMFFEKIVYVLDAPSCPRGSILAIGNVAGPGGTGPGALESTLVLARSFADWLAHLERWGWVEWAVASCEPPPEPPPGREIVGYYLALNPDMNVHTPREPL